jgi:acetyl-CoA carboxylase biotin carboxyl carrier protein
MEIDMKQLRELMRALRQFDLSEIELRQGDQRIAVRRNATKVSAPADSPSVAPRTPAPEAGPTPPAEEIGVTYITSPFVGTFYRSPSPEAPPFVDVGSMISVGQVVCIIEAMKLMNEIETEASGRVMEVLAENGKPVEYGQRLFKLQK